MVKYNFRLLENMRVQLNEWIIQSSQTLVNEESRDYPNEERLDMLNARIDALQAAYDALGDIE